MFNRIIQTYIMLFYVMFIFSYSSIGSNKEIYYEEVHAEEEYLKETVMIKNKEYTFVPEKSIDVKILKSQPEVEEKTYNPDISDEDIDLIALVTMAEAEAEVEEGKRMVIDTILNRYDSEHFPDTIRGIVYQPNQFTSMWNGRTNRCHVREDIRNLVIEELINRSNSDVIFFRTTRYSDYGSPMFKVGNHYFSSYY